MISSHAAADFHSAVQWGSYMKKTKASSIRFIYTFTMVGCCIYKFIGT